MRQFYNIYIHKWQMAENIHRIIQNNRNTMEHKNRQNRSVSYMQSIGAYFKCIINILANFCNIQTLLELNRSINLNILGLFQ